MATVTLLEPMTRFACNLRGCCCKGWLISFRGEDFGRVVYSFDDRERDELVKGWRFWLREDRSISRFQFARVGKEGACQFLAPDGRCGLQTSKGVDVLPRLCRTFPGFATEGEPYPEVHFDAMCPEVMRVIADTGDDTPMRPVVREVEEGSALAVRAERPHALPDLTIGPRRIELAELALLRDRILDALHGPGAPAIDRLAAVHVALAEIAAGRPPGELRLRLDRPVPGFGAYLDQCVATHEARALARLFEDYRRFVFALPLDGVPNDDPARRELARALEFDSRWRDALDPRRDDWQPFLGRYLCHRFFSGFNRSPNATRIDFTYGTITHGLATGFRYALGLSRWLGRPLDAAVLEVGLGASEQVYRMLRLPASAMPWFSGRHRSEPA